MMNDIIQNNGKKDAWILNVGKEGDLKWGETYGNSGINNAADIIQNSEGEFIVCGSTVNVDSPEQNLEAWIFKIDSIGNEIWSKSIDGNRSNWFNSMLQVNNGDKILVLGNTTSNEGLFVDSNGNQELFISQFDDFGELEWLQTLGGESAEVASKIIQGHNNTFLMINSTFSNIEELNNGLRDAWIVNLELTTTSVANIGSNELLIYPNPTSHLLNFKGIDLELYNEYCIYDINSKIHQIGNLDINKNEIDISNLEEGVFTILLKGQKRKIGKIFIKYN